MRCRCLFKGHEPEKYLTETDSYISTTRCKFCHNIYIVATIYYLVDLLGNLSIYHHQIAHRNKSKNGNNIVKINGVNFDKVAHNGCNMTRCTQCVMLACYHSFIFKLLFMKTNYNKRIWLNDEKSSSTSSFVAFDGYVDYGKETFRDTFIKISDCSKSIKLHKNDNETMEDFINRLELLKKEIDNFSKYLKK